MQRSVSGKSPQDLAKDALGRNRKTQDTKKLVSHTYAFLSVRRSDPFSPVTLATMIGTPRSKSPAYHGTSPFPWMDERMDELTTRVLLFTLPCTDRPRLKAWKRNPDQPNQHTYSALRATPAVGPPRPNCRRFFGAAGGRRRKKTPWDWSGSQPCPQDGTAKTRLNLNNIMKLDEIYTKTS